MKGIAFGILLTVVAGLLSVGVTFVFGGSGGLNFLLALGATLAALAMDVPTVA
jgi:hypothetical protein